MDEGLPYQNTWKGKVIKAISVGGAEYWEEIQEDTRLPPRKLNLVIAELANLGILTRRYRDGKSIYRVSYEIYKEYNSYFNENLHNRKYSQNKPVSDLKKYVEKWNKREHGSSDASKNHFYLTRASLTEFSKECIKLAKKSILIVNPYIDENEICSALEYSAQNKVIIKLATRKPKKYNWEIVTSLREAGVTVNIKKDIHAKIIIVDEFVGIVSSQNFQRKSITENWEAGIVSFSEKIVQRIADSVNGLI